MITLRRKIFLSLMTFLVTAQQAQRRNLRFSSSVMTDTVKGVTRSEGAKKREKPNKRSAYKDIIKILTLRESFKSLRETQRASKVKRNAPHGFTKPSQGQKEFYTKLYRDEKEHSVEKTTFESMSLVEVSLTLHGWHR